MEMNWENVNWRLNVASHRDNDVTNKVETVLTRSTNEFVNKMHIVSDYDWSEWINSLTEEVRVGGVIHAEYGQTYK